MGALFEGGAAGILSFFFSGVDAGDMRWPDGDSLGACGWTDGEFSIPSFDGDAAGTGGIGGVI